MNLVFFSLTKSKIWYEMWIHLAWSLKQFSILTLNMLNCLKDHKRCIHIWYRILDFVKQNKSKLTMKTQPWSNTQNKNLPKYLRGSFSSLLFTSITCINNMPLLRRQTYQDSYSTTTVRMMITAEAAAPINAGWVNSLRLSNAHICITYIVPTQNWIIILRTNFSKNLIYIK